MRVKRLKDERIPMLSNSCKDGRDSHSFGTEDSQKWAAALEVNLKGIKNIGFTKTSIPDKVLHWLGPTARTSTSSGNESGKTNSASSL